MEEVEIIKIIPHVVRSRQRRIWIDYDEDADVLYMNFTYRQRQWNTKKTRTES